MKMMQQATVEDKTGVRDQLEALQRYVESAARSGSAAHEVERDLFRGVLQPGHRLLGYFFSLPGEGDQGATLELADGQVVRRLDETHSRSYQSVFGEFTLVRCVYGSREGQRLECVPLDTCLQLPQSLCSYLLQDWTRTPVVEMPYPAVNQILGKILGFALPVSLLERLNAAMGQHVEAYWEATPAMPTEPTAFIVAGADGKGVPMRKPADSPPIQAHDSRPGPEPDRKKVAVVGAVYDSQPYVRSPEQVWQGLFQLPTEKAANDDETTDRPKPVAKVVRASLTQTASDGTELNARDQIFEWSGTQVDQRDPAADRPLVVIMDGQTCLWDDANRTFSQRSRVEILDLLHVTSKLWKLVHVFHPPGSAHELEAMKLFTLMILNGQVEAVIRRFGYRADEHRLSAAARKQVDSICGYFRNHQTRMCYDQYLAAGYPIASGVIEGACRHVVKDRLERTGMCWTIPGVQAMLKLRCVAINDQWDEFTEYRIKREAERLYPHAEQPGTLA